LLQAEEAQTILAMKPASRNSSESKNPRNRKTPKRHFPEARPLSGARRDGERATAKNTGGGGSSLAACGEEIIAAGRVAVNGNVVTELGTKADS